MKRLMSFLLAILIAAFLFSGCEEGGGDNNSGNGGGTGAADSANSLIGVWRVQIMDGTDISSLAQYTADFDRDGSDETVVAEPIFAFTPTTVKRYYKITAVNADPGTSTVATNEVYTETSSGTDYFRNGCAFYTDSETDPGMVVFVNAGDKMYWSNLNTQHNYELERLDDTAVDGAISY